MLSNFVGGLSNNKKSASNNANQADLGYSIQSELTTNTFNNNNNQSNSVVSATGVPIMTKTGFYNNNNNNRRDEDENPPNYADIIIDEQNKIAKKRSTTSSPVRYNFNTKSSPPTSVRTQKINKQNINENLSNNNMIIGSGINERKNRHSKESQSSKRFIYFL